MIDIYRETEGGGAGAGGTGAGAGAGGTQDADYFRAEAKKAFEARDTLKAKLRALEESGRVLTDEQVTHYKTLEESAAKAEEDRKRKAGEFDSWRADFTKKTETELATERDKAAKVTERLHTTLKDHAFASASDWFGGTTAKTILTPAIASAYFGRYVAVEDRDGVECVVVKGPDGHAILDGKTGRPAAFAQAIGELIGMLPDKDSILRGSGKTGSGNSGGSHGTTDTDLVALSNRAVKGDKEAIKLLRQHVNAQGGVVMGAGRAS